MASADTSIYNLLRPQKTAFDNFLRGQEAKQNYEQNQQIMQARQQKIQQAAAMDPLLLQEAQQGIDLNAALNPEKIAQQRQATLEGERAYQQQLKLDPIAVEQAQAGVDLTTQQTATSATAQEATQLDIDNYAEKFNISKQEAAARIGASKASAGASRAAAQASQHSLKVGKREEKQAIEDQEAIFMGDSFDKYESLAAENPEAASLFLQKQVEEYKDTFGKDFDPQSFNGPIARVNALLADQRAGNIEQAPGLFGASYNKRTGEQVVDPVMAKKGLELKKKALRAPLSQKDIHGYNKDVDKYIKPAVDISSAYNDLKALRENANPVAQGAMITRLVKAMDPESTVSVTESGMVVAGQGPLGALESMWNTLLSEGKVTEDAMDDIISTAASLAGTRIEDARNETLKFLEVSKGAIPPDQFNKMVARIPEPITPTEKDVPPSTTTGRKIKNPITGEVMIEQNGKWVKQ